MKRFDSEMTWFILFLDKTMKYRYFIDVDGIIKQSEASKYSRFDPLVNSLQFTGVQNSTQFR